MKTLIVNLGSTSKRYAVYSKNKQIFNIHLKNNKNFSIKKILRNNKEIKAIGIRVISPGVYFQKTRIVNKEYMKKLEDSLHMAPLHIKTTLEEIKILQKQFPNAKIIGVSDSEFHSTLPEKAKLYAIPQKDSHKFQIYRYGYHGISIKSILSKIKSKYKKIHSKIIVCHLGGGSSITAIKNGKSIETSMGFTPLEGLPMVTRSGNIDFSAALYLAKSKSISMKKLEEYLNTKSGLLGLSEASGDMEKLIVLARSNGKAKLALDKFIYETKKYIGAYVAILGGTDLLVFTGAIGENATKIRRLILKDMKHLEIKESKVIHTNEIEEIFRKTTKLIRS